MFKNNFFISLCKKPSQKVLVVDESPSSVNDGLFVPGSLELLGGYQMHVGRPNIMFFDGHLEGISRVRFLAMQEIPEDKTKFFNPLE